MDRNTTNKSSIRHRSEVALRKESVDRNVLIILQRKHIVNVALRKESVDRNTIITQTVAEVIGSLSARRAWIEITIINVRKTRKKGRSPQGERG